MSMPLIGYLVLGFTAFMQFLSFFCRSDFFFPLSLYFHLLLFYFALSALAAC